MPPSADGWTIEEAAQLLDPPITVDELRAAVLAARLMPLGLRHTAKPGRRPFVYDPADLMRVHAALVGLWMGESTP